MPSVQLKTGNLNLEEAIEKVDPEEWYSAKTARASRHQILRELVAWDRINLLRIVVVSARSPALRSPPKSRKRIEDFFLLVDKKHTRTLFGETFERLSKAMKERQA